jgi:hypothetical protein
MVNRKEPTPNEAAAEAVRVKRLREDASRPMSVNLAETIALSHMLMRFAGAARRASSTPPVPSLRES